MLLLKQEEMRKEKKMLSNVDHSCLRDLISAIDEEFSEVLKIKKEEVYNYIEKRIVKLKK